MIPDSTNPRVMADNIRALEKKIESGGGGGSDLPDIGPSDYGSYLAVDELGKWGLDKPDIPSIPDYSTTEQKTGLKWVDGRDIYQRTYHYHNDEAVNTASIVFEPSDSIDLVIKSETIVNLYLSGNNQYFVAPWYASSSAHIDCAISAESIGVTTSTNWPFNDFYSTIYYVKTPEETATKKRKTTKGEN